MSLTGGNGHYLSLIQRLEFERPRHMQIKNKIIMIIMISYLYRLNLFDRCCYQSRTCLKYTKLYIHC